MNVLKIIDWQSRIENLNSILPENREIIDIFLQQQAKLTREETVKIILAKLDMIERSGKSEDYTYALEIATGIVRSERIN
jgi:hypothetical protein